MSPKHFVIVAILAISLTGQACLFGSGRSGPAGVWKSTDGSATWNKINLVSSGGKKKPAAILDTTDIRAIVIAPDRSDILYLATPAGVYATDSGGQLWFQVLQNVDVRDVAVSKSDPEIIYAVGNVAGRGVVYKSANRGREWQQTYIEATENPGVSIAIDPKDEKRALAGFASGLIVGTANGGQTWALVKNLDTQIQQIQFHPFDSRRLFVLARSRGLFVSDNGGVDMRLISTPVQGLQNNSSEIFINFDVLPVRPDTIYMTTDAGLFRTVNRGVTWSAVRLPVNPENAVTIGVEVAGDGRLLYVSIDTVIYKSLDGGTTFNIFKLPTNRLIRRIVVLSNNSDIVYAGLIQ